MNLRGVNVTTVSTGRLADALSGAVLWSVNVNTAGSGAILKLYNNTSAVTADLVATIDASALGSYWYGIYCPKGIFYSLTVAAADITIGYA